MSTSLSSLNCHTDEKQEYFLNDLNDGLAYALEAQDFVNFQGMVNKALVLENYRGMMEHKRKLVRQTACRYAFSWTYVPSCSAVVLAKAIGSWTRIFHPTTSSDSAPQQFADPYC
jgi:hypothetical protein